MNDVMEARQAADLEEICNDICRAAARVDGVIDTLCVLGDRAYGAEPSALPSTGGPSVDLGPGGVAATRAALIKLHAAISVAQEKADRVRNLA